ncbi:MAG: M48 family metallopeptidase [Candidatus Kapaibacterium sp.]
MNTYAIIITAIILIEFIVDNTAKYLNLKALDAELPSEFADVYDADTYRKSQEYTKTRTKFGFISSGVGLVSLLLFWYLGGFEYVNTLAENWSNSFILRGLYFFGVLIVLQQFVSLPFSIYSTFVIEERFGFNKTTVKTFIIDMLKGLLLMSLIGGAVLALILYIFNELGELSWLYAWGAVIVFTLIMQYIAPKWIMPLFNKFKPLEDGELKQRIIEFAEKVDFQLQDIFIMDGSKRSSKSNAFFTGFGKNKRIALFDTLVEKHTTGELVSVLAHEIGHYKRKHIVQGMFISIIHTGVLFFLLSLFLYQDGLYEAFYMDSTPIYAGFLFFSLLYSPLDTLLSIGMNMLSRKNEYEADEFAVVGRGNREDMISALKKLSKDNLSNLTPHKWYVFMNYSHPPVIERIRAIKTTKI